MNNATRFGLWAGTFFLLTMATLSVFPHWNIGYVMIGAGIVAAVLGWVVEKVVADE